MKKTALVIMAAGIGSRFGKGIKQLAPVGPNGEIIMDYSIHDALEAGFNKVVFIIRKDIEEEFRKVIGNRIEKVTEVEYAFQELEDLPAGLENFISNPDPDLDVRLYTSGNVVFHSDDFGENGTALYMMPVQTCDFAPYYWPL